MKALAIDELKLVLEFSNGYLKPRCTINEITCLSSNDKRELLSIKFYLFGCRKRYHLLFLYVVYTNKDIDDIIMNGLSALDYIVTNIVNIHTRKKVDNKTYLINSTAQSRYQNELKQSFDFSYLNTVSLFYFSINVEKVWSLQRLRPPQSDCTERPRCIKYGKRHILKKCKTPESAALKSTNCSSYIVDYRGCLSLL